MIGAMKYRKQKTKGVIVKNWICDFFVIVFSFLVFFRRINSFPLRNWDEAWYGEIIKNMASGKYGFLMPYWNGRFYFDNEPLYFWLSFPFVKLFGISEWQVRIISATTGVLAAYLVFLIARKLNNVGCGIFSFLIFLTIGGVVIRFSHGNLDALLVCLFLSTFYFYLKSEKLAFNILSGLTFGLGLLVKSWGIGLFPLFWIVVYSQFIKKIEIKKLSILVFCGLVISLPWYFWGILKFGEQFVTWYLLNPAEGRLATPINNFSLAYFRFVIRDLGLWLFTLFGFLMLLRRGWKLKISWPASFTLVSLTYITFLNFLGDKSDWYLIPAFAPLSIVLGWIVSESYKKFGRVAIIGFGIFLVFGYFNVLRIENLTPDRSIVGARVGQKAQQLIPYGDEVLLDDHDFTAFLYYLNHDHIYTLQEDRKLGEWWIIKKAELNGFLSKNKAWIVTKNESAFRDNFRTVDSFNGYFFMRSY